MKPISRSRVAMGSYQYMRYPLEYFLDTARGLGYSRVELWAGAPHLYPDALDRQARRDVAECLKSCGLQVSCLTPEQVVYPFNLAAREKPLRQLAMGYYLSVLELAAELESPHMLVTAGCAYFNEPPEVGWARSLESVSCLARRAGELGIQLLYETLTPPSSNILNTPEQMARMLSQLPGNVGAIADLGQIAFMGQRLADYIDLLGQRLWHVHLHDYGDAVHMALGEGGLPIGDLLALLENSGYSGTYALEVNDSRYRKDPAASDKKNTEFLLKNGILEL